MIDLWIVFSQQAIDAFKARRQAVKNNEEYDGPMDAATYRTMSKMADMRVRQNLYKKPILGGKTYLSFHIMVSNPAKAKPAVDALIEKWPGHVIVVGAFDYDTGLQGGLRYVLDGEGKPTEEVTGTIAYPILAQAYKLMPDRITYGSIERVDGQLTRPEILSSIPASSNADLRDINLQIGQAPRIYST